MLVFSFLLIVAHNLLPHSHEDESDKSAISNIIQIGLFSHFIAGITSDLGSGHLETFLKGNFELELADLPIPCQAGDYLNDLFKINYPEPFCQYIPITLPGKSSPFSLLSQPGLRAPPPLG